MFIFLLLISFSFAIQPQELVIGSDSTYTSPGCENGTCSSKILNPILAVAFPDKQLIWTNLREPDLMIRSPFRDSKMKNYSCPYINLSGEPYSLGEKEYPPIVELNSFIDLSESARINKRSFWIPHILDSNYNLTDIRKYKHMNRPYLIAYMNSNCQPHREAMFKKLVARFGPNQVHALGKCSWNKALSSRKGVNMNTWHQAYDIYQDYTFVLAMENTDLYGYITEKIMNAFIAGSIPIYWGSQGKIRDLFNSRSFINTHDFDSYEDVVDYIDRMRHVDLYKYQFASIFHKTESGKEIIPSILSLNKDEEWIKDIGNFIRLKYDNFKKS